MARADGELRRMRLSFDLAARERVGRERQSHVYFASYRKFGPPHRDDELEMTAPQVPLFIRAIGYQDRQDHLVPGDDRIVIYYQVLHWQPPRPPEEQVLRPYYDHEGKYVPKKPRPRGRCPVCGRSIAGVIRDQDGLVWISPHGPWQQRCPGTGSQVEALP